MSLSWRAPACQLSFHRIVSWVFCFTLLLVSYLVYHVLRATAVQSLSYLIELWLPWVVERSNFILHGEFCKPRYVTEEGGNLALKGCVKEPEVELMGILKGVYGNLLPYFSRKFSWSWVPNLGLLENPSFTAERHSFYLCLPPCCLSAFWSEPPLGQSGALPQTPTKVLSREYLQRTKHKQRDWRLLCTSR